MVCILISRRCFILAFHICTETHFAVLLADLIHLCDLLLMMAEGFAIFGAINGAIGACLALRNGIDTIYQDAHTLKRIRKECQAKLLNMYSLHIRLTDWRDKWMIWHEDEHSRLHQHLWGDRFIHIYHLLSPIQTYMESISRTLKAVPRSRIRRFGYGFLYTFVKKKALIADLGELERMITDLDTNADTAFDNKHLQQNGTRPPGFINWICEAFQLVHLAKETHMSSESLYMECIESSDEVVLDLGLNFFHKESDFRGFGSDGGEETRRSKARLRAISASANERKVHFTFLAAEKRPADPLIRVYISNDTSLAQEEYQWSLPRAFEEVYSRRTTEKGFESRGELSRRFVIRDTNDTNKWAFQSLRRELSRSQSHDSATAPELIYLTKLKAALELIEGGLLFLLTSWFSELCSCTLSRHGANLYERIHTVRTTATEHVQPGRENLQAKDCWCTGDPTQGMYIRRLGVLLVEFALEASVFDVGLATNSRNLQLAFPYEKSFRNWTAGNGHRENWADIEQRLQNAGVKGPYIQVAKSCLECQWTRDQVRGDENLLWVYYWKILHP